MTNDRTTTVTIYPNPSHVANLDAIWVYWVTVGRAAEWLAGLVVGYRKTRRKVNQKTKENVVEARCGGRQEDRVTGSWEGWKVGR